MNDWKPVTLEGKVVRLESIRREHTPPLWDIAKDATEDIFRWIPYPMGTLQDFERWMEKALAEQARGESLVFTTVERSSARIIGSTRFMNIDRANRRAEIGSTWIAPAWQRTAVNTEAKYLMLRHAFEEQGCIRVELKNRCPESEVAQRHPAHRSQRRRHIPQAPDHINWTRAGFGLLQHPGYGAARGESQPGT